MDDLVIRFGGIVSSQVQSNPKRARNLLSAAYALTGFRDRLHRGSGIKHAYSQMNAIVSKSIVDAFQHPQNAVMVNIFFPCEMLHAMDITPMFPEGLAVYATSTACETVFLEKAEDAGISESLCSYHKAMIGLAETGVLPAPMLIANTSLACDANQLSFRRLAEHYQIPHCAIDVPYLATSDAIAYVAEQLRGAAGAIEDAAHKKMDEQKLVEAVAASNRTIDRYRQFLAIRGTRSLPATMSGELLSLIAMHVFLGTEDSERYVDALNGVAKNAPSKLSRKRILWIHTLPNWQDSMQAVLEQSGRCEIVGCDLTFDGLVNMDPEKPYESMAKRVVENSNNGSASRRIETILEHAKKLHADGIVVFCHWGCKHTQGLSSLAKQSLEAEGYPTLILDSDGCDRRNVTDGQMITRVHAFIEQLENM